MRGEQSQASQMAHIARLLPPFPKPLSLADSLVVVDHHAVVAVRQHFAHPLDQSGGQRRRFVTRSSYRGQLQQ